MDFRDLEVISQIQTRRGFLQKSAGGLGTVALWHLLSRDGRAAPRELSYINPLAPKPPHFAPRAKNVIFLFMSGAPSQLDLFDPKPTMAKWDGQPLPESVAKGLRFAFIQPTAKLWASPRSFRRHGESGLDFSDYVPHMACCADDICMIRSMHTEQINHFPAHMMISCGTPLTGRPSMGAWVTYGLGSESRNLPAYIVLNSGDYPSVGAKDFSSGFLPSSYQGVPFRSKGDPVLYLSDPEGISRRSQRAWLDALGDLKRLRYAETGDVEIASRIASYELAFRMQAEAPDLLDLSNESERTLEMYGVNNNPDPFALWNKKADPSSPWWKYLNLTGNGFRSTTSERGLHPEFSQKGSPNLADQLFGGVNEAEHQQHGAKNLGLEAPGSPGTDLLPQEHPQIEGTGLNQQPFEDVRVPSDLGPPQSPGAVKMGKRSLQSFPPHSQ